MLGGVASGEVAWLVLAVVLMVAMVVVVVLVAMAIAMVVVLVVSPGLLLVAHGAPKWLFGGKFRQSKVHPKSCADTWGF